MIATTPTALARRLALIVLLLPSLAWSQGNRRTSLTTTGFPLTGAGTTVTDFDAGSVTLGSTSWSVDLTTNSGAGGFSPRVTTVQVRCATPCATSGTAGATLEWRRTDLGTWNPLTATFTTIESRTATFNGTNDPWSNSMAWRYALTWTGSPPAAVTTFSIEFQLTVTAP